MIYFNVQDQEIEITILSTPKHELKYCLQHMNEEENLDINKIYSDLLY